MQGQATEKGSTTANIIVSKFSLLNSRLYDVSSRLQKIGHNIYDTSYPEPVNDKLIEQPTSLFPVLENLLSCYEHNLKTLEELEEKLSSHI